MTWAELTDQTLALLTELGYPLTAEALLRRRKGDPMNMQLDPWLDLADAAGALLARLRDVTTEEFSQGGEKAEREALDAALVTAWQELYRVTSFAFDPNAQTVALAERAGQALARLRETPTGPASEA